jgi:hypothetical protein
MWRLIYALRPQRIYQPEQTTTWAALTIDPSVAHKCHQAREGELESVYFDMAENKTKPTSVSVSDYVDALSQETKRADSRTLIKLMQRQTGAKPKMGGRLS